MSNPTKPPRKRQPIRSGDVVLVPLCRGELAQIDVKDFDALRAAGVSDQWTLNSNGKEGLAYVRVWMDGAGKNQATVARLILRPIAGSVVKYRDGNPLNLRRSNLYLKSGWAKNREGAAMVAAKAAREGF